MSDDGDFTKGGSGGNIPAGEVFISPVVGDGVSTGCQGKIVFDGSIAVKYGTVKIETPIETVVENGFITDIRGGKEADMLLDTITTAERSAKEMGEDGRLPKDVAESYRRNARNIGELGIGLNPAASIKGNMLEDEKAFCTAAKKYNILLVPGSSFGCPGYVRIAYCVAYETIVNSLPKFAELAAEYR